MIVPAVARKYARALSDLAFESGAQDAVARDLEFLDSACRQSPELASALGNPGIPQDKKIALLEALWAQQQTQMHKLTRNLIALLLENGRIGEFEAIHHAFQAAVDERFGIVAADVTTRFELGAEHRSLLAKRLEEVTGSRVKLNFAQDEQIIGGVILRIGSTVYDGSVRRQLDVIRLRLVQQ